MAASKNNKTKNKSNDHSNMGDMKMNLLKSSLLAGLLTASALSTPAFAESVLRLDEVAVGELDPGKASDYADSILMFNVYDTLVLPVQGGPGYAPHLAASW